METITHYNVNRSRDVSFFIFFLIGKRGNYIKPKKEPKGQPNKHIRPVYRGNPNGLYKKEGSEQKPTSPTNKLENAKNDILQDSNPPQEIAQEKRGLRKKDFNL